MFAFLKHIYHSLRSLRYPFQFDIDLDKIENVDEFFEFMQEVGGGGFRIVRIPKYGNERCPILTIQLKHKDQALYLKTRFL